MRCLLLAVLVIFLPAHSIRAEYFWGVTTVDNRLLIRTNEAIVIQRASPSFGPRISLAIVRGTNTYALKYYTGTTAAGQGNLAIAGPCEAIVSTNDVVLTNAIVPDLFLSFKRFTNSPIRSIFLKTNETQSIIVPRGSTIHFLANSQGSSGGNIYSRISDGISTADIVQIFESEEFDGPLQITVPTPAYPIWYSDILLSYYFTQNAVVLTLPEAISAPTGSFAATVESSSDLTNWFPDVFLQRTSDYEKYYRLKVEK